MKQMVDYVLWNPEHGYIVSVSGKSFLCTSYKERARGWRLKPLALLTTLGEGWIVVER